MTFAKVQSLDQPFDPLSHADNLEIPYNPLSYGNIGASDEEVSSAIDTLIKKVGPLYEKMLQCEPKSEVNKLKNSNFNLCVYSLNTKGLNKEKYSTGVQLFPEDLNETDPLHQLLKKIPNLLLKSNEKLAPESGLFDVRFDKGILNSESVQRTNLWHFDTFIRSATVSYSTKKNWSTRIIEQGKVSNETSKKIYVLGYSFKSDNLRERKLLDLGNSLEHEGIPSQHGVLYNAVSTLHRAPKESDVGNQEIGINDYRLFIRYTESG